MTNPVLDALANARARDAEDAEAAIEMAVANFLGHPPKVSEITNRSLAPFVQWCEAKGGRPCPARPATVALFILESATLGVDKVWDAVGAIATLHNSLGLPNPAASWPVSEALSRLAQIKIPQPFTENEQARLRSMPFDVQISVVRRHNEMERAMRRAQNESSTLRKQLENTSETSAAA